MLGGSSIVNFTFNQESIALWIQILWLLNLTYIKIEAVHARWGQVLGGLNTFFLKICCRIDRNDKFG